MKHTQSYFERSAAWTKNAGTWSSEHRYPLGAIGRSDARRCCYPRLASAACPTSLGIGASRASRWQGEGGERKWVGSGLPEEDLESFTDHGLQPAIVNGTAGDLILFDTARELQQRSAPAISPRGL